VLRERDTGGCYRKEEEEELTRVVPAPSNPPTLSGPDLRLTPWACQGAYTRKCLLLYDVDHVEGPGPGVST